MSRTRPHGPHGLLLVNKPAGPTSAAMVDWARWALGGQPVGHFGTLDPGATGLLVLGVGYGTRLTAHLTAENKTYRATLALGTSTDTDDADGRVVDQATVSPEVVLSAEAVLRDMVGQLDLPPPAVSAVKVDGQRAYARVREGLVVELPPRRMHVFAAENIAADPAAATVDVTLTVSKGSYVRSIAVELGRRLGCPAHLKALERTACGDLTLADARVCAGFSVEGLPLSRHGKPRHRIRWQAAPTDRESQSAALNARLLPLSAALPFACCRVQDDERGTLLLRRLHDGQSISTTDPGWRDAVPAVGSLAVVAPDGAALVLAEADPDRIRPQRIILPWRERRPEVQSAAPDAPTTASRHRDSTP